MKSKKVFVAMSGGIDSSVAALLLKKSKFEVTGVFMRYWHDPCDFTAGNKCCSLESEETARRVATQLKIKFIVLNVVSEFKERVVDFFLQEYAQGNTPNPCVECNRQIKFKLLLEKIKKLEGNYLATGHYAKIEKITEPLPQFLNYPRNFLLLKEAKDKLKDQSYFLYNLNQEQLSEIILPLGNLLKTKVKEIAQKEKLPVPLETESQSLCFVPWKDPISFLKRHLELKPGKIIDQKGKVRGKHAGLPLYTIGQRKGIGLGGPGPYFVFKKDLQKNILYITEDEAQVETELFKDSFSLKNLHWISNFEPKLPCQLDLKIRYHSPSISGKISKDKNNDNLLRIKLNGKVRAITPGQSAIIQLKDIVLGGGVII
jgi:tRNA-specific 2-thiouridylase